MLDHSFETVDVSLLFHEWSATDIEVSLRKHHHFLKYNFVAFLCPVLLDARGDAAKDWRKAGSSGQGPLPGGEWPSAGQVLAESGGHDDCGAWTPWSLILWTSFYLVGSEMLPAIRRVMISALVQCSQLQTREFEVMEAREKRVQSQWRVFLNPQSSFPMFQSRDWLQDGPGEGEVFYVFFGNKVTGQPEPSGQEFCMEASIGSNRHALANGDQKTQPVRLGCQVLLAVAFRSAFITTTEGFGQNDRLSGSVSGIRFGHLRVKLPHEAECNCNKTLSRTSFTMHYLAVSSSTALHHLFLKMASVSFQAACVQDAPSLKPRCHILPKALGWGTWLRDLQLTCQVLLLWACLRLAEVRMQILRWKRHVLIWTWTFALSDRSRSKPFAMWGCLLYFARGAPGLWRVDSLQLVTLLQPGRGKVFHRDCAAAPGLGQNAVTETRERSFWSRSWTGPDGEIPSCWKPRCRVLIWVLGQGSGDLNHSLFVGPFWRCLRCMVVFKDPQLKQVRLPDCGQCNLCKRRCQQKFH